MSLVQLHSILQKLRLPLNKPKRSRARDHKLGRIALAMEQLEARAMLSANMGGSQDHARHWATSTQFDAATRSNDAHHESLDRGTGWKEKQTSGGMGDFDRHRTDRVGADRRARSWGHGSDFMRTDWRRFPVSAAPPGPSLIPPASPPVVSAPPASTIIVWIRPVVLVYQPPLPNVSSADARPRRPPNGTTLPDAGLVSAMGESVRLASSVLPGASAVTRAAESIATLIASASQTLFQDSSLNRLIAISLDAASDSGPVVSAAPETVTEVADATDGQMSVSKESDSESPSGLSDSVHDEQAAIDEVMESLHDLNELKHASDIEALWLSDPSNDRVLPNESNPFSLNDIENGMVLLEACGDANMSDLDLTHIAEQSPQPLDVRLGVEASLEIYQVFDAALDESEIESSDVLATPVHPTSVPQDRSTESTGPTFRKAALAIGITGLVSLLHRSERQKRAEATGRSESARGTARKTIRQLIHSRG